MGTSSQNAVSLCDHRLKFMQPIRPGFLNSFSIPTSFLKKLECDLKGHDLQSVTLMTQHEPQKRWVVSVESGRVFSEGWKEFCIHINLQVGEFVVFAYQSHSLFHVTVFEPVTACERIPTSSQRVEPIPETEGSKRNEIELNSTFEPEVKDSEAEAEAAIPSKKDHTSCIVNLTVYNVRKSIIILPVGFVRKNRLQSKRCELMVLDAEQRVWPVIMNYKKNDGQVYIKKGWKPFLTANRFRPGNLLCIRLIKGGDCLTLKCYRVNRSGVESNSDSETSSEAEEVHADDPDVDTASPCPSSEQDQSQYPICHVCLSSYNVEKSIIYLPASFVRESDLKYKRCEVKVVDEEERKWRVSLGFRSKDGKAYLCRGWRDVQTENCFMVGDVVRLQLIEAGERPVLRCFRSIRGKKESTMSGDSST